MPEDVDLQLGDDPWWGTAQPVLVGSLDDDPSPLENERIARFASERFDHVHAPAACSCDPRLA